MKDYTVSFELVIQALVIFEGLSLWKWSEFAAEKNSASLLGKNLGEEFNSLWQKMKRKEKLPWGGFAMAIVLLLVWPICQCANYLVRLFKWTPYFFGIAIPLAVASCFIWKIPPIVPADWSLCFAKFVFWFIVCKFSINVLTPLVNRIPFSQVSVEIQPGMIDNIKR